MYRENAATDWLDRLPITEDFGPLEGSAWRGVACALATVAIVAVVAVVIGPRAAFCVLVCPGSIALMVAAMLLTFARSAGCARVGLDGLHLLQSEHENWWAVSGTSTVDGRPVILYGRGPGQFSRPFPRLLNDAQVRRLRAAIDELVARVDPDRIEDSLDRREEQRLRRQHPRPDYEGWEKRFRERFSALSDDEKELFRAKCRAALARPARIASSLVSTAFELALCGDASDLALIEQCARRCISPPIIAALRSIASAKPDLRTIEAGFRNPQMLW